VLDTLVIGERRPVQVILQIRTGPRAGQVFQLRVGQAGRFGRSEWADFPFPEAADLADEQFLVDCRTANCTLRNLADEPGTTVNGAAVDEVELASGDVVAAGSVEFVVYVDGAEHADSAGSSVTPAAAPAPPRTPADLAALLALSDPARELAATTGDERALLDALVEAEHFDDAVRLTAFLLDKPAAVRWAADGVRSVQGPRLAPADLAALDAAVAWADDPTDEHRRAANAAAEATDYSTGAAWVALAAFWSEGSLAPAGLPAAPPGETLCCQGVTGALMIAATSGAPLDAADRYRTFLATGREKLDAAE
jgi:hypothetical protein